MNMIYSVIISNIEHPKNTKLILILSIQRQYNQNKLVTHSYLNHLADVLGFNVECFLGKKKHTEGAVALASNQYSMNIKGYVMFVRSH